MSFLEARKVCKVYRAGSPREVRALEEVSLAIPRGSFAALMGPSGSGKTTLLALLGALERPTRGQVLFEGRDLNAFSDMGLARVRRRMGFIFQDFSLIPNLPVWENITYPLIPRGFSRSRRFDIAQSLLVRCGLADKGSARPEELSGGEQQRVAAARALAGEPEILLADEPTSNLDPEAARTLSALLRAFQDAGKTVVVSSHDPQLAALAGHVFELRAGRLVRPANA
jgi:putative ABC transport system ATP-binding protein